MTLEADIIIAGAGAAGLSLAGALAHPALRSRVLVLEPRTIVTNGRHWVFPAEPGHALSGHVTASFDAVSLGGRAAAPLSRVRLFHVPAEAVQAAALERMAGSPALRLEEKVRIDGVVNEGRSVRVETSLGAARARLFVDTRPVHGGVVSARAWTQIAWSAAVRDVDAAPGFTLSAAFCDHGGVGFDQTLVLPDGEVLIEVVRLARPGDQGDGVEARLDARLRALGVNHTAVFKRRLVAPLDPGEADTLRGAVLQARAGAGGLRFGPGVEALRLTRWAEAAATRFYSGGRMTAPPGPRRFARAVTRKLLRQLESGPEPAALWLNAMLARLSPDAGLRFLAGAPRWRRRADPFEQRRKSA
ncbi:lycopene cyclase family protein [Maricaulaceae bacterium MS644]